MSSDCPRESNELHRDQLIAVMIAELDAQLYGRGEIHILDLPDSTERRAPAVDLLAADDHTEVVVEHTRIESFERQTHAQQRIRDVFPRGGPHLPDCQAAGYMAIGIRHADLMKVRASDFTDVDGIITGWIRERINSLSIRREPTAWLAPERGMHPDVPFEWKLTQRISFDIGLIGPAARVVHVSLLVGPDIEELRARRLGRALTSKLPKLRAAGERSRRTLLVVEDDDITYSAPLYVSKAMCAAAEGQWLPDAIYYLDTGRGNPTALTLYERGEWAHQSDMLFNRHSFTDQRCSDLNLRIT